MGLLGPKGHLKVLMMTVEALDVMWVVIGIVCFSSCTSLRGPIGHSYGRW